MTQYGRDKSGHINSQHSIDLLKSNQITALPSLI